MLKKKKDSLSEKSDLTLQKSKQIVGTVWETTSQAFTKGAPFVMQTTRHIKRNKIKYAALTSVFGIMGALYTCYDYLKSFERESTAIGKAVGDHLQNIQKKQAALNKITQEASENRKEYKKSCLEMARTIRQLYKKYPDKDVASIIDTACFFFKAKCQDKAQEAVIIEDMQTIKKYFPGTAKDLHNIMCYYHLSPEIKFNNRYSEPFEVRNAIWRYERKVNTYLHDQKGVLRKSMLHRKREK